MRSWSGSIGVMAWVALAGCPPSDAPPSDEGAATETTDATTTGGATPTTTSTDTSTGMPTTAVDTTDDDGGPSSSDGSDTDTTSDTGSSSSSGSDTDTSTGSGSGSSSTGTEPSQPCLDQCATQLMCTEDWASDEECYDACLSNLQAAQLFAISCRAAWEDLGTCLGTLDCTEYAEWQAPMTTPYPCISEDEALMFECQGQ